MKPADRSQFGELLKNTRLEAFQAELLAQLDHKYANPKHGNFNAWQETIDLLPEITPSLIDLTQDTPIIGSSDDCSREIRKDLEKKLKTLSPWRKGPFDLFGIHIDSEWRSNWKWSRIAEHIKLKDKLVLDIGCGNGYYALRMQAMGAKLVVGVDPSWLFVFQFLALQKYLVHSQYAFVLPFALEELPASLTGFDTIFSMGVLYHRQEPQAHLIQVHQLLENGGQLILETLIIEDDGAGVLIPNERYANMRNVWMLPSYTLLRRWLQEVGYINIRLIDKTKTAIDEQQQTEWMTGFSLVNALDPDDPSLTIEGHPAPLRAIVLADKAA